jgi:regulatory protein
MIPAAIEKITLHLFENNFLNEERYAKSFARGKYKIKKWGRRKIERELSMNGISSYNIRTGLLEIEEETYHANLLSLTENKFTELGGKKSPDNRRKLFSYLLQKGYESDLIYEVLSKFGVDEN